MLLGTGILRLMLLLFAAVFVSAAVWILIRHRKDKLQSESIVISPDRWWRVLVGITGIVGVTLVGASTWEAAVSPYQSPALRNAKDSFTVSLPQRHVPESEHQEMQMIHPSSGTLTLCVGLMQRIDNTCYPCAVGQADVQYDRFSTPGRDKAHIALAYRDVQLEVDVAPWSVWYEKSSSKIKLVCHAVTETKLISAGGAVTGAWGGFFDMNGMGFGRFTVSNSSDHIFALGPEQRNLDQYELWIFGTFSQPGAERTATDVAKLVASNFATGKPDTLPTIGLYSHRSDYRNARNEPNLLTSGFAGLGQLGGAALIIILAGRMIAVMFRRRALPVAVFLVLSVLCLAAFDRMRLQVHLGKLQDLRASTAVRIYAAQRAEETFFYGKTADAGLLKVAESTDSPAVLKAVANALRSHPPDVLR